MLKKLRVQSAVPTNTISRAILIGAARTEIPALPRPRAKTVQDEQRAQKAMLAHGRQKRLHFLASLASPARKVFNAASIDDARIYIERG